MSEYEIRAARADEKQLLRPLWQECFGDTTDFITCYEERIFRPDRVELALLNQEAVAMLTVIPAALHTAAGVSIPGGCVYGVATRMEHRSKGLASKLLDMALHRRLGHAAGCVAVVPDTPALFPYYEHTMGAYTAFSVRQVQVTDYQLMGNPGLLPASAEPEIYWSIRRRCLQGKTYFDWDQEAVGFQREICRQEGGDLFRFPDAPDCCAAVERLGSRLLVAELLAPENDLAGCLAGLLEYMRCLEAEVRLPAWSGAALGGQVEPFAMLAGLELPAEEQAYLGFDFA